MAQTRPNLSPMIFNGCRTLRGCQQEHQVPPTAGRRREDLWQLAGQICLRMQLSYSDDMLVNYSVQGLLPTASRTLTEGPQLVTTHQLFSLPNVVRFAQAEGQTSRATTAILRKSSAARANRKPVMLIASPFSQPFEDHSTGPPTSWDPDMSPLLLVQDADRASSVSIPVSYRGADDCIDTLDMRDKSATFSLPLYHR